MNTLECIKTRRSRRLFTKQYVERDKLVELLEAAICAPSSRDCQPWHFIVVRDEKTQKELANLKSEDNQQHILTAPISVVICADTEKSPNSWIEDSVTAAENLLLAAHALGLGAVYISGFSHTDEKVTKSVKNILELPENIMPVVIVPLGYADENEELENKDLLNLNDVKHIDKW